MGRHPPDDLNQRFQLLLKREEEYAGHLAQAVLDKPEVSVWMILIPILLVQHAHRVKVYGTGLLFFAENVLQTKKRALEKARGKVAKPRRAPDRASREPDEARCPRDSRGLGHTKEPEGTLGGFTDLPPMSLEEADAAEVELLTAHYRILLMQRGETHVELIRSAYPTAGSYRAFLKRLARAEADVHRAVVASRPGEDGTREIVSRMEGAAGRLRDLEVALIYGR